MTILHGTWIENTSEKHFFIWGETWRSLSSDISSDDSILMYPFSVDKQGIVEQLNSNKIKIEKNKNIESVSQIFYLPSKFIAKSKQSIPLLSTELKDKDFEQGDIQLIAWKIEGIKLNVDDTINILSQLPLGLTNNDENYIGDNLKFWTHIYRWSLDLLTRGKYLPQMEEQDNNCYGQWEPLLDSLVDQQRFSKFIQTMPNSSLAYHNLMEGELSSSLLKQTTILDFLSTIINQQVRQFIDVAITPSSFIQKWLYSLTQDLSKFEASEVERKGLKNAINNWKSSLSEYIIKSDNQPLGINQFRICFKLETPAKSGKKLEQSN